MRQTEKGPGTPLAGFPTRAGRPSYASKTRLTGTLRGLRLGLHSSLRVPPAVKDSFNTILEQSQS